MSTCIALLRGINVGKAKRIPMVELRALLADLGFETVRTLLNSGNALFDAPRPQPRKIAAVISAAILGRFDITVPVIVVTARALETVVAENPLREAVANPSRLLVAFFATDEDRKSARSLLDRTWTPESFGVASQAAYLACAPSVIESPLAKEFARLTKDAATMRNWTTVQKLLTAGAEA